MVHRAKTVLQVREQYHAAVPARPTHTGAWGGQLGWAGLAGLLLLGASGPLMGPSRPPARLTARQPIHTLRPSTPHPRRGNMGGGFTQIIMPYIFAGIANTQPNFIAWRCAFFIPAWWVLAGMGGGGWEEEEASAERLPCRDCSLCLANSPPACCSSAAVGPGALALAQGMPSALTARAQAQGPYPSLHPQGWLAGTS